MKNIFFCLLLFLISVTSYSQEVKADFDLILTYECGMFSLEVKNKSVNADSCFWDFHHNGQYVYYESRNPKLGGMGDPGEDLVIEYSLIAKGFGHSDTITKSVEYKPSRAKFDYVLSNPSGYAPSSISISNKSVARNGDTLTYKWRIDTLSTTVENPTYYFAKPKTYSIYLEAKTQAGCVLFYSPDEIILKDSAQIGEFDFINSDCFGNNIPPCGLEKHYILENNSLKVFGFYGAICCKKNTATLKNSGDTIFIRTFQTGGGCACGCAYCFEINVPNITKDSVVVSFDGKINVARKLTSVVKINIDYLFALYPNPVENEFTISCNKLSYKSKLELLDMSGRVVYKHSKPIHDNMVIRCNTINSGVYILNVNIDSDHRISRKIVINHTL